MAGGPAFERWGGGSGGFDGRGGVVYEGRDSAFESVRWEAGEGGSGLEEKPISDAVFVLCWEHIRRRTERAAGFARIGGNRDEIEEGEGNLEKHA